MSSSGVRLGTATVSDDLETSLSPSFSHEEGSIYSLSRASFSSQLSQLTSLPLPKPAALSSSISSLLTSTAAVKALTGAAEQIQKWIRKASDLLGGLDAEDDVEWAAAGGRDGLAEVDGAVGRFEGLIGTYVESIERLQLRDDAATVPAEKANDLIQQMETILVEWREVRASLNGLKEQMELAMEWEELWNVVFGDISTEKENLCRMVFQLEEKRHMTLLAEMSGAKRSSADLIELETMAEGSASKMGRLQEHHHHQANSPSVSSPSPPLQSPRSAISEREPSLLALVARMQPLRASLDFLPMRLSSFYMRAQKRFPTACQELQSRREELENEWKSLEKDADALRHELSEDRFVAVFRSAGRQAQTMCESVSRSIGKLKEAIRSDMQHSDPASFARKIETHEAKKVHYGPAIERVIAIIERGVSDRLTVNGEILRLQAEIKSQWESLEQEIREMDGEIDRLNNETFSNQLRDSISTVVSMDQSIISNATDTPRSSVASSTILANRTGGKGNMTPRTPSNLSFGDGPKLSRLPRFNSGHRDVVKLAESGTSRSPRVAIKAGSRSSYSSGSSGSFAATMKPGRDLTPPSIKPYEVSPQLPPLATARTAVSSTMTPPDVRPKWNSSPSMRGTVVGHDFHALHLTEPSRHDHYQKKKLIPNKPRSMESMTDMRSPRPRLASAAGGTSNTRIVSSERPRWRF